MGGYITDIPRTMILVADDLLRVAQVYAQAVDKPLSTVSSRVFDDGKKLDAIERGFDLQSRRLAKAIQWFSDNWPDGAAWPVDIDRPRPTQPARAEAAE